MHAFRFWAPSRDRSATATEPRRRTATATVLKRRILQRLLCLVFFDLGELHLDHDESPYPVKKRIFFDRIGFDRLPAFQHVALDELVALDGDFDRGLSVEETFGHRDSESVLGFEISIRVTKCISEILVSGVIRPLGLDEAALAIADVEAIVFHCVEHRLPGRIEIGVIDPAVSQLGFAADGFLIGADAGSGDQREGEQAEYGEFPKHRVLDSPYWSLAEERANRCSLLMIFVPSNDVASNWENSIWFTEYERSPSLAEIFAVGTETTPAIGRV